MRPISTRASPGVGAAASCSRAATSTASFSASSAMRSMTLRSSRTLPGQGRRDSQSMASSSKRSLRGRLLDEGERELRDVLGALGEGGHGDGDDVQAIEEVLAEAALGDAVLEVDVGRGEHAREQRSLLLGAERAEAPVLEDAQELGLELAGHLGDLVEQDRARAGELELAADAALGAREGAALVAEDRATR